MITDQVVTLLTGGQMKTSAELAQHIPSLAGSPYGAEVIRLLLRLDHRFRQHGEHWLLREGVKDPSQQILQSIRAYFLTHPRGELLKHLIPAIATETGQPESEIERIVRLHYRQVGTMILNQPKEHS